MTSVFDLIVALCLAPFFGLRSVPVCMLILVSILVAFWSLFGFYFGTTLIPFADTFPGIDLCIDSKLIYADMGSLLAPLWVHLGPLGFVLGIV